MNLRTLAQTLTALLAPACLTVEYTGPEGGGGSGGTGAAGGQTATTTGGGPAGGAGGGPECVPNCSDDHRCGDDGCDGLCGGTSMPATFGLRLEIQGLYVLPWPETESVFVSTDSTDVHRVDACTGEVMATYSVGNEDHFIRGLARFDDELLVLINLPGSPGQEEKQAVRLDARSLDELESVPIVEAPANGFWSSSGAETAVWSNLTQGGHVLRVQPDGASCGRFLGNDLTDAGGIVAFQNGAFTARNTGAGGHRIAWVGGCGPADDLTVGPPMPDGFIPYSLAVTSTDGAPRLFAVGFYPDPTPTANCGTALRARVAEIDRTTLEPSVLVDYDPMSCVDGLVFATARGSDVYAVGGKEGLSTAGGLGWVVHLDANEVGQLAPTERIIEGAALAWFVAADDSGVYLSGAADGDASLGKGFLVKCTHDLSECGAVP
ncbi:MAG: hypothetical protein IPM79_13370 [Polyangiaceae bacterium]|nr:hypothetical protein [Polyangiaceae bacterium]